jgi:TonB-dependent SusC/RagA subfamily outer membrane receptor
MRTRIIFCLILLMISFNISSGQKAGKKVTITGHVVDETQAYVANAIVMIDGKKTDTFTNAKGYFKIKVIPGSSTIGILTTTGILEEPLDGRKTINFTFQGSVPVQPGAKANPDDETVDIGYGSVRKIDGTNPKYASYRSIYDMLRGEVPGVQVTGTSIRIQGASSLMLSTEPLFVVDGMVVNSIADIQPYTVKSIEILKGSSAAIYGSRGANGVILIKLVGAGNN